MKLISASIATFLFSISVIAALCGSLCDLHTLDWQQEFSEADVDTSIWNFRTDQKALSAQLAANVDQNDDHLIINLKKQQYWRRSYLQGKFPIRLFRITNPDELWQRLAYLVLAHGWQVRAPLTILYSTQRANFCSGSTTSNVGSHTRSEIDIFERDSTTNASIAHNINLWKADNTRQTNYGSGTLSTSYQFPDWHIFGALWNETNVAFYIDGKLSATLSFPPSKWTHDYLNIWITSLAYQVTPDDTKLPSKIQLAYVRYYQKDYVSLLICIFLRLKNILTDRDQYLTAGNLCFSHSQGSIPCPSNQGYKETGASWLTSSLSGYTLGLVTRYSCHLSGAKASWSIPSAPVSGTYEIWAWIIARSDSDPAVFYDITKDGTSVLKKAVDQTSGSARWMLLASNQVIKSGQKWSVTMTASSSGCARADTVKFVRTA
ncbi:Fc.00g000550.m01.CDS01 [Cosmosporella sp. VM-42]